MAQLQREPRRASPPPTPRSKTSTGSNRGTDADSVALDEDAIFDVLRANRRRAALRHLEELGGEASIGELAEHVAASENDVERDAVTPSQRKRVYIALYQSHLPKIANYGAIEFDRDTGLVRLLEPSRSLLPYLTFGPGREADSTDDGVAKRVVRSCVRRLIDR